MYKMYRRVRYEKSNVLIYSVWCPAMLKEANRANGASNCFVEHILDFIINEDTSSILGIWCMYIRNVIIILDLYRYIFYFFAFEKTHLYFSKYNYYHTKNKQTYLADVQFVTYLITNLWWYVEMYAVAFFFSIIHFCRYSLLPHFSHLRQSINYIILTKRTKIHIVIFIIIIIK